jgi:molybdopterin converting factor subunit 1
MATVTVLYFAHLPDRTGTRSESVTVGDSTTVGALRKSLEERHNKLQGALGGCRVAVDEEFADAETILHDGQTVAFIPPVSGG